MNLSLNEALRQIVLNSVQPYASTYREPLLGIVPADNPEFKQLKTIISEEHKLPEDLLPGARSVIAFFLPFSSEIVKSNSDPRAVSEAWARSYIDTNRLIDEICQQFTKSLNEHGYQANYAKATHNFDEEKLIAWWSHRSVAHLAGLGEWGLNRMLITPRGCAGRYGSLVTDAPLAETGKLLEKNPCLYFSQGKCGVCVKRCPVQALTLEGFDRQRCYKNLLDVSEGFKSLGLADVCGKCLQTPCAILD